MNLNVDCYDKLRLRVVSYIRSFKRFFFRLTAITNLAKLSQREAIIEKDLLCLCTANVSQCEINFSLPSLRWDLITDFRFLVCFAFERGTWGVENIWLALSDLGSIPLNNDQKKRYGVLSCNLCQFLNYLKKYCFQDIF